MFDLQIHLHLRFNFAPARLWFRNFTLSPVLQGWRIDLPQLLKEILLICFFLGAPFYSQVNSHSDITPCDGWNSLVCERLKKFVWLRWNINMVHFLKNVSAVLRYAHGTRVIESVHIMEGTDGGNQVLWSVEGVSYLEKKKKSKEVG